MIKPKVREFAKKYMLRLAEDLSKASEDSYYVGSIHVPDSIKEIAEELGFKYIPRACSICGRKIYLLNVKTRAKPLCEFCFLNRETYITWEVKEVSGG